MSGDYTRFTDKPQKRYSGVLMQQGRVQLDADWNEQTEIVKRRWQTQAIDTFGHCAVPKDTNPDAFKVLAFVVGPPSNLTLGEGRIYVEGLIAEILKGERFKGNPITYLNQPFYPNPAVLPGSGNAIVFLDVWEREVTYIEDPDILEKALGGPDTATRTQTVWQVKVWGTTNPVQCGFDLNAQFPPSGAQLTTQAIAPPASDDPCIINPSGGYRGLENRLYRVEIHTKGKLGAAKFKWSRENASIVSTVKQISTSGGKSTLTVTRIGRDKVLRFQQNDWVEVLDDNAELRGEPGFMAKISAAPDEASLTITLDRAIPSGMLDATDASRHTRLRRWDQQTGVDANGLLTVTNAFTDLEDGVQVRFDLDTPATKNFEVGDYWVFAARTADSSVEPLVNAPPRGIIHNYCQLAAVSGLDGSVTIQDCRPLWPKNEGGCCCCTITVGKHKKEVGDFPDLQSAMAALPGLVPDTNTTVEVCLLPGAHALPNRLTIDRPNTKIKGCGPNLTKITSPETTLFIDARGVTLEGVLFETTGSFTHALLITDNAEACRIAGNAFDSHSDAFAVAGEVDGLNFIENEIRSGNGFVSVAGTNILIAGNRMIGPLRIKVGSETVRVQENEWSKSEANAIVLGANQVDETRRTISEIDIIDNRIESANGSAIVSGRFSPDGTNESQALGLRIIGNQIINCVKQPAPRVETDPPLGGIILATAQHLTIRDNRIENNGVTANAPVCGIFVRNSRGMEISDNQILNNGHPPDGTQIKGAQGGIIAPGVAVMFEIVTTPGTTGVLAEGQSFPKMDGFPAALIADNIVSAPRGLALALIGIGPMLVHGNHLASHDLIGRGGDDKARPEELIGAVLIINFGMSSAFSLSLAGMGFRALNTDFNLAAASSTLGPLLLIGGKVQFIDNHVTLDLSHPSVENGLAAIGIFSIDDVNASNNQTECILLQEGLIFDMLVLGFTTRQIGNGLTETPMRCLFSMLSIALALNTGADNQGTHCIYVLGAKKVDRDNLVLLPNPQLCPASDQ
jgi:hypothetical protein